MSKTAGYGPFYHGIGSLRNKNSASHTQDKPDGPPDDPEGSETPQGSSWRKSCHTLYKHIPCQKPAGLCA